MLECVCDVWVLDIDYFYFKLVFKMIVLFLFVLLYVAFARNSCAINNPVPCGFQGVFFVSFVFFRYFQPDVC